jgi:hypothetical protein
MERLKKWAAVAADIGKLIALGAAAYAIAGVIIKIVAWTTGLAHATEVTAIRTDVAVLKAQFVEGTAKADYMLRRVDAIGDQLNNLALTGKVNYVPPPPAPPMVIGPQLRGDRATR